MTDGQIAERAHDQGETGAQVLADKRDARGPPPGKASESSRLAEHAYQEIRQAILSGELKAGEHLHEEKLATLSGTSRTPVREALRRLVAEGLAKAHNRHRFVTDFSFEEMAVIFEVRARLESYAAQLAAPRITAAELAELERLIADIDALLDLDHGPAAERFIDLNAQFHAITVAASRSRQLTSLTAQASAMPLVVIKQSLWRQNIDIRRSNDQHRDILAALAAGNADWAAHAVSSHILATKPHGARGPKPAR
ncbi:MAG: GntR family transcriptional regulator [Pseudomonadota bacterium]